MNLRFDTSQGEDTWQMLNTCFENIENELNAAKASVDSLIPGAWEAPAANQFQGQFEGWYSHINTAQQELEQLRHKLRFEIDQWEETASRLAGG